MSESPPNHSPTAAVLVIGNEILSGRTVDCNLNTIATRLTKIGIPLKEARVIPDLEEKIITAVNELRKTYTYLFTTGGIGPTHDDITVDAIAKAFGLPIVVNQEARDRLRKHYTDTHLNEARLRMARTPKGASLIPNPISAAPGIKIENVFILAGVPSIMTAMMDYIVGTLTPGPTLYSKTVSAYVAESIIAKELGAIAARFPDLDIGSYPWVKAGRFGTALVTRGTDQELVSQATQEIYALVSPLDPAPDLSDQ